MDLRLADADHGRHLCPREVFETKPKPEFAGCAKTFDSGTRAVDDHGLTQEGSDTEAGRVRGQPSRARPLRFPRRSSSERGPGGRRRNGSSSRHRSRPSSSPPVRRSASTSPWHRRAGGHRPAVKGAPTGWTATLHGGGFVVDGATAGPGKPSTAPRRLGAGRRFKRQPHGHRVRWRRDGQPGISVRVAAGAGGDITLTTAPTTPTGASDAALASLTPDDSAQDVTTFRDRDGADSDWTITTSLTGAAQAAATTSGRQLDRDHGQAPPPGECAGRPVSSTSRRRPKHPSSWGPDHRARTSRP